MIPKKSRPFFNLIALVLVGYGIHKLVFNYFEFSIIGFYYTLESLYFIFFLYSCIIFIIIAFVRERYFDQIGMIFMGLTTIKMIGAYLLMQPILNASPTANSLEKNNFFVIFIVFLLIETVITVRILNEKRQNDT